MENFLETIGSALFDAGINDQETMDAIDTIKDSYTLVQWPDSQELMEEDWFEEEAILDVEGKFGGSAYFVPTKYLID